VLLSYHLLMSAGGLETVGSPAFTAEDSTRYRAAGWWSDLTLSDAVGRNAEQSPHRAAYVDYPGTSLTWREFDYAACALAEQLAGIGVARGDRVAVWHGDSAAIHVLFVAIERCGAVVVGIGARAGTREVGAILRNSEPKILISDQQRGGAATLAAADVADESPVSTLVLGQDAGAPRLNVHAEPKALGFESQLGPDDVFLINSTSGTAGLPKCVVHTQNRWYYFHQKAAAHGLLTPDDIFLPVIPTPFGFGIWTSHTTPIYLGATAVILERFTTRAACEAIARHKVTVLCCVSTQLTMLMADRASRDYDLSSLRVVFAGGEPLPYRPAVEFEELTGAKILQFYGSNETGLLSGTRVDDSRQRRLRTGGRIVPEMSVRLFDGDQDVTETGCGQPACRGPATSLGYLGGADHDKLFTRDGWMRMGDICEIDADGYLSVTGRTSDFILRGGKNISAAQVEDAVTTHPAIAVAAAVAMLDPVFGEKVCLYTELADSQTIDLPELVEHLLAIGVSKELLPERLIVVDELPRSSGGRSPKASFAKIFEPGWRPIMNAPNARRGGLEVWAPSVVPPIGVELSKEQALAVAFRHLAAIGFAENMAGHITWQPDGQTDMLVNPWGLWWQELTASDICMVDADARVVRGRWDVTPAIHIHTELHRVRDDARVVIHNHPYYVCVLAALGRLPELVHQTGSLFLDDLCLVETYDGEIDSPSRAADLAAHIGSANLTILANHGVIATGRNLAEAVYRAASIERVCKLAYDVMLTGKEPVKMNWSDMAGMQKSLIERAADVYWAGAARMIIKADSDVLT
jgi:acyl-CoA synthetase